MWKLLDLLQKCLSTGIPSIYPRESVAQAFQPVLIKDIILILHENYLEKLRVLMLHRPAQAGKPVPPT
jgi:hypothetical protein